jgi:pyruvate carboxylase subunit B
MVLGYFGKTPVPADRDVVQLASEQLGLEPTTRSPREINDEDPNKGIDAVKKLLTEKNLEITDESIFIASSLKQKGIAFLMGDRPDGIRKVDQNAEARRKNATGEANSYTVDINGRKYEVSFAATSGSGTATVNGKLVDYSIAESTQGSESAAVTTGSGELVCAELTAQVLRLVAAEGDSVAEGDVLLTLEALKMEIDVRAPHAGTVSVILVSGGQSVAVGDPLVELVS